MDNLGEMKKKTCSVRSIPVYNVA